VGKIAKKTVQRYTPTDCFFGDFAHWEGISYPNLQIMKLSK